MALIIERGPKSRPQRVCLYAPEGIGKSTLASRLPSPLFLDFEDGTDHLDVARMKPATLAEAERILASLSRDREGFETLVIDTIDWMEEAVIRQVIADAENDRVKSIEDFGYGKGYVLLTERMNLLLSRFDRLIDSGMNVVLLAHAMVTKFEDPRTGGAYDRFELKMHKDRKGAKGTASLIKEWCDALLLGQFDDKVKESGDGPNVRHKAVASSGKTRVLYCTHSAAWDAKNRHGLEDREPWGIETLMRIVRKPAAPAKPAAQAPGGKSGTVAPAAAATGTSAGGAEKATLEAPKTAQTEPGKPVPPAAAPVAESTSAATGAPAPAPAERPKADDPLPGVEDPEDPDPELERMFHKDSDAVNRFLRDKGKVGPNQSFRSMDKKYRSLVMSNPANFLARVRAYVSEGRAA